MSQVSSSAEAGRANVKIRSTITKKDFMGYTSKFKISSLTNELDIFFPLG
jgi:hypothetical protein